MSIIKGTISDLQARRMHTRLQLYENLIEAAPALFELDGRSLEDACKSHANDLMSYNVMLQECKTIEDIVKMKMDETEGILYKKYNENQHRALGQRDIVHYIKGDPDYVQIFEVVLEVTIVRRKLEAIVEALQGHGWSISNIVKLRIAQLEHVTL